MDTPPAALVKGEAYGIDYRILRANVDIESTLDMRKSPPQHDVFKILRV
jgi:hypothetical protein